MEDWDDGFDVLIFLVDVDRPWLRIKKHLVTSATLLETLAIKPKNTLGMKRECSISDVGILGNLRQHEVCRSTKMGP
jgi:hypothetical protein